MFGGPKSESTTLAVSSQDPTDPSGQLPEGTFTFRANYVPPPTDADDEESFDWGFSLDVEAAV